MKDWITSSAQVIAIIVTMIALSIVAVALANIITRPLNVCHTTIDRSADRWYDGAAGVVSASPDKPS